MIYLVRRDGGGRVSRTPFLAGTAVYKTASGTDQSPSASRILAEKISVCENFVTKSEEKLWTKERKR